MTKKPAFSIIIPAYNVEAYIANTLNSIFNQSFSDYELIVIDDGSSDGTLSVCKSYEAQHADCMTLISTKNSGVSAARNKGIEIAKGQYVMFADGDDYLHIKALELLNSVLVSGYPDMLYFDFVRTDRLDECELIENPSLEYIPMTAHEAIKEKLGKATIPCNSMCIKNSILKENSLRFDEELRYVEDALFLFSCMLKCQTIWHYEMSLYYYLKRSGSATGVKYITARIEYMQLKAWIKIKQLLKDDKELARIVRKRATPFFFSIFKRLIKPIRKG